MATASDIILYKVNSQGKFVETLYATETYNYLQSASGSSAIKALTSSYVGISNLTATGTPSATTYLRGDNTWATITSGIGATGPQGIQGPTGPAGSGGSGSSQWTTSGSNIYYMNNVLIGTNSNPNNYKLLVKGTASFNNNIFYMDGSGYLSNNNIYWDIFGNLTINGNYANIVFLKGNEIQLDCYGLNSNGYPYLFLGDYHDGNNGNTIFIDDANYVVKFGNFNSGFGGDGINSYDGSDMNVKAQINTQDGSGSLSSGNIYWDGSGNLNVYSLTTLQPISGYSNTYWSFGDANNTDPGNYWGNYSGVFTDALSVSVAGHTYLIPSVRI